MDLNGTLRVRTQSGSYYLLGAADAKGFRQVSRDGKPLTTEFVEWAVSRVVALREKEPMTLASRRGVELKTSPVTKIEPMK